MQIIPHKLRKDLFENFDWKNGQINEEQLAYLKEYANWKIATYLSPNYNKEYAEECIKKAYTVAGLKEPRNITWYKSPEEFLRTSFGESVWGTVRGSVRESVWGSVGGSFGGSVRESVWGTVGESVRGSVWESVRESVRESVWGSVRSYYTSDDNSFFQFFSDMQEKNNYEYMSHFMENCCGFYLEKETVHIIQKPVFLSRDANGRLDNDQRMAIEWADGYGFYYLHGVEFDKELWQKVVNQEFTLETIGQITNADQRTVAIQMMGVDNLLSFVDAKLIETGQSGTSLYRVDNFMDTGRTEYCIAMQHPSLDKKYIEWAEPEIGAKMDADLCQGVAFKVTKEDYQKAIKA